MSQSFAPIIMHQAKGILSINIHMKGAEKSGHAEKESVCKTFILITWIYIDALYFLLVPGQGPRPGPIEVL